MSISGNNKIVLKGDHGVHEEGPLAAIASPGMNLVVTNAARTQERDTVTPGSTDYAGAGTDTTTAKGPIKILKEDALRSKTITDAYASGDDSFWYVPLPGDVLQVLVASGQTVTKGDGLSAGADGKWVTDTTNAVVEALEASGGALAADNHVRVRVL